MEDQPCRRIQHRLESAQEVGWDALPVYLFYRYHRRNYADWLLCLGLLPVAWAAQQHSIGQKQVKTHDNQEHE